MITKYTIKIKKITISLIFLSLMAFLIALFFVGCSAEDKLGSETNQREQKAIVRQKSNLPNWTMNKSFGPGYNGKITYGDNKIIDPTTFMGERKTLFKGSGGNYYRIPTLLTLKNGDILAFADYRYNGAGDLPNQIEVWVRKSKNNGTNWGLIKRVTPASRSKRDGHGDIGVVLDRNSGDIVTVVASGQGFFQSTASDPIRIKVIRSKDNGETWLAPVDITSQIYGAKCKDPVRKNWQGVFSTSGNGIQLRNGRIMFVLVVRETNSKFVKNYVMYSDDGGYNWKVGGSPENPRGGNEAKVAELNDGSLLMHIRWTPNRLQSRSYDNGKTWTEATVVNDIPASSSNGDLIVYTSKLNGYDKNRLITMVDSRPWGSGNPGIPVFYVSYDEGRTWSKKRTVWNSDAGYSSLAILKDGSIGILTELTQPWRGPIWFLRTSIEWVNPDDNPKSPKEN